MRSFWFLNVRLRLAVFRVCTMLERGVFFSAYTNGEFSDKKKKSVNMVVTPYGRFEIQSVALQFQLVYAPVSVIIRKRANKS